MIKNISSNYKFHIYSDIVLIPGLFLLLSLGSLYSKPLIFGKATDSRNNPIPFVTIHNISTNSWLTTDEKGEFILSTKFTVGDTLELTRIGYKKTSAVIPVNNPVITIKLPLDPVTLKSIEVSGRKPTGLQRTDHFAEMTISPQMGLLERQQVFSVIPGIYIKSYGGAAGVSTLSLDGAPSSHTSITFGEFDITNAQNGLLDISQLPMPLINKISYSPLLNTNNPESGSSEGSIEIHPDLSKTGFTISTGSFEHYSLSGTADFHYQRLKGHVIIGKRHDGGNYPVINPVSNSINKRQNNKFSQQFIASSLLITTSRQSFLRFLALSTQQERGIAGLVWSPTPDAKRNDLLQMIGSKFGWTNRLGYGYSQFLFRQSKDHYANPQNYIDTRHTLQTYQLLIKQFGQLSDNLDLLVYLESKYDYINSSSTDIHDKISYKAVVSLTYRLFDHLSILPGYMYNHSPDNYSKSDYDLRCQLHLMENKTNFYINVGNFYRFPNFNDLYWQPGGNPNLKPENTQKIAIGTDITLLKNITFSALAFSKESRNLILWTPLQSYWQPKNIRKSVRKGYKFIINWNSRRFPVSGNFHYSYNISEDRTPGDYYKKPLRYAPKHSSSFSLTWHPSQFLFHFQLNHVGKRIAMYSWPEDIALKAYNDISFSSSYTWDKRFGALIFTAAVTNLMDTAYATLLGYPEPGRSFRLTMTYEFN